MPESADLFNGCPSPPALDQDHSNPRTAPGELETRDGQPLKSGPLGFLLTTYASRNPRFITVAGVPALPLTFGCRGHMGRQPLGPRRPLPAKRARA